MLKVLASLLILTLGLPILKAESGESIQSVDVPFDSSWKVVAEGGKSEATVNEDGGVFTIGITKTSTSFCGVEFDISEDIADFVGASHQGGATEYCFTYVNGTALPSTEKLVFTFAFQDGSDWTVKENQTNSGFPQTYDAGLTKDVSIDLGCITDGEDFSKIKSITIGFEGKLDCTFAVKDFKIGYSDESPYSIGEAKTSTTIGAYGSGFGKFQYGGAGKSKTAHQIVYDPEKSAEDDGSSLEVSVSGTGSTSGWVYSSYFQLASEVANAGVLEPTELRFYVYNAKACSGGLVFKVGGSEITDAYELYEAGEKISNSRNLDFVGLRQFRFPLTSNQFKSSEMEIGMWGVDSDTKINLSAFSFIGYTVAQVGYVGVGSMGAFAYSQYTDGPSFDYAVSYDAGKSRSSDGSRLTIDRQSNTTTYYSCVYLQSFGDRLEESGIRKPTILSLWVYNERETTEQTGLAFKFKGSDSRLTEVYPAGNDRGLNFTGFRNYKIDISNYDVFQAVEFEMAVWGVDEAAVSFSDIEIFDASMITAESDGFMQENIGISNTAPIDTKIEYTQEITAEHIKMSGRGSGSSSFVKATVPMGSMPDGTSGFNAHIEGTIQGEDPYARFEVIYDDGSGVEASHIVASVDLRQGVSDVEYDFADLPYFIGYGQITGIRLTMGLSATSRTLTLTSFKAIKDPSYEQTESYSYLANGFESSTDVGKWSTSGSSTSIYFKEGSDFSKVGNGSLYYEFASMDNSSFSWSEVYTNVQDTIETNASSGIKGLSFWLYNSHYVTSGAFGFWIKVAQSDGLEFEAKYTEIMTEWNTSNNLAWEGWQKVNVPLNASSYTECDYNQGYYRDAPRSFDVTKLAFVKFGFWGIYYNAEDGYSAQTYLDDFRFVSAKPMKGASNLKNINYILNGGSNPLGTQTQFTEGEEYTLPTPTRFGYTFLGWYTKQSLTGSPITKIDSSQKGDLTLYAAWKYNGGVEWHAIAGASVGVTLLAGGAILFIRKKKRSVCKK